MTQPKLKLMVQPENLTDWEMYQWLCKREFSLAERITNMRPIAERMASEWAIAQIAHLNRVKAEINAAINQMVESGVL